VIADEPKYLKHIPSAADIPAGMVVVHNQARPAHPLGMHGFRAWLQAPSERLEVCPCSWAPDLPAHYRITPELLRGPLA